MAAVALSASALLVKASRQIQASSPVARVSSFRGKALRAAPLRAAAKSPAALSIRAERDLWYPGAVAPKYLDGTLAGDKGFDPLGFAANNNSLSWYKEAELTNGRWAMAAVAGILFTDAIGKPNWWEAGAAVDLPFPLPILVLIEIAVFAVIEGLRLEGWKKTGGSGLLFLFPFDPLGLNSKENQEKEVENGRAAMVAFFGFIVQAAVTGKGPISNLTDHISDPFHNNVFTTELGPVFALGIFSLQVWAFVDQARRSLGADEEDEFSAIPW